MIVFTFIQIKHALSEQRRPCSDATLCGVWSGFALFALFPQKDASLIWDKRGLCAYIKKHKGFMSWPIKEFVHV